jgi:metal-dependent amidase/aminoacylase/carboxypeptidase family protein
MARILLAATALLVGLPALAADGDTIAAGARALQPKVVAWRRDIHEHPELSNMEFRTAALVADHLRALGLEVRTGIAKTGVVGVLRGGKPGGVVALRADMDALPVQERTGLPFASQVVSTYLGDPVPVMHACGHDAHVAMLMGAAELLAGMRADIPGTVVFVFQPAEEGPPPGEEGGAALMMKEGVFRDPSPSAVFAMHVSPHDFGTIRFKPEGYYAAASTIRIQLRGRQTHGARVTRAVSNLAESYGATAEVEFTGAHTPVYNDPALVATLLPSLVKAAGDGNVDANAGYQTTSEDIPHLASGIPGLYVRLGGRQPGTDETTAADNHSPFFDIDERVLEVGVRTHAHVALDYLGSVAAH